MLLTAVLLAGTFSVWAAILYFQLRHVGLTALALFAPFPFAVAACAIWSPWERSTEVLAPFYAIPCYVFGVVGAQILAGKIAQCAVEGTTARGTIVKTLWRGVATIGAVTAVFAGWMLATGALPLFDNLAAALVLFAVGTGTLVAMAPAAWFPKSEQFIAQFNRAREQRELFFDHLLFIAERRWSLSLAGVAMIFAALAAFGMRTLRVQSGPLSAVAIAAAAVFLFVGGMAVLRNWRLSVAFVLTMMLLGMIGFWIFARGEMPALGADVMIAAILLATAALPALVVALAVAACLNEGDDITVALSRGLQKEGANAVLSAILCCVPWLLTALSGGYWRLQLSISLASLTSSTLIFPALAGAIYAILPRYRTVDEVFGKR